MKNWAVLACGWYIASLVAGGCAGGGARQSGIPEVNTGLSGLAGAGGAGPSEGPVVPDAVSESSRPRGQFDQLAADSAVDLNRVLTASSSPTEAAATSAMKGRRGAVGLEEDGGGSAGAAGYDTGEVSAGLSGEGGPEGMTIDPHPTFDGLAARSAASGAGWSGDSASPGMLAAGPAGVEMRIEELAIALASLLREKASTSGAPIREYLALAAVEPLGSPDGRGAAGAGPESMGAVSPEGLAVWGVVRDLMNQAAASGSEGGTDEALAATLTEGAQRVADARPMRVSRAVLCRQVTGFGNYEPAPGSTFLAGQAHRLIVYVELENFAHRKAKPEDGADSEPVNGDSWAVEVSQELDLRHSRDDVQAWYRPPQVVVDVSRNKRRDFFVRQIVELPPTLSVGSYGLKVTMRDKTTGASDEAVLPITIVADPALAGASVSPAN